jgi:putative flippase GtrA
MIGIKYATFAVFSIGVNLLFQYLSFFVYDDSMSLYIAMLNGTLAGLICKYILDNKYIFFCELRLSGTTSENLRSILR